MKNIWLITGAILMLLGVAGCGKTEEEEVVLENEEIVEVAEEQVTSENNLGEFTTQDIYGETVTQEIFADYDLTMVNLFATWCGPCISEMPELARLQKDMKDQGVNVVAVVLDASYFGEVDQNVVATAQELVDLIDAEFTFMIPDETNLNGRLDNVSAVPESFFVDKDGNMVGEPYVGARDYDTWKSIMEYELGNLSGAE